jgi:gamma-glutamylcyclotransferase (GGCT)/AIG2-like uncharacterized protein YtfP
MRPRSVSDLPLAVYGTLRPGGRAHAAFGLAERTRHLGPCRIAGRIVDLGGYPGLLAGNEAVAGDLLGFDDPALLDELDAYEGEGYLRATVRLVEPAGEALVWLWQGSIDGALPVPGNDWSQRVSNEIDPTTEPSAR